MSQSYRHIEIENKWGDRWIREKLFSVDMEKAKKPFYNLMMFPYPSAEGLHAGNMFAFTGSDIYGRYQRMNGHDVFEPIGLDGFGIHSENFALKIGKTPQAHADNSEKNYYKQLHDIGNSFDWTRTLETYDIDYYRWTQWLFIEMFKAGLAYKKTAAVNWCPGCKTVLADEQIMSPQEAGKIPPGYDKLEDIPEGIKVCERCGNIPEKRDLSQWFFKITDYADRLLEGLKKINWSERVVSSQRKWIGKSDGARVKFSLAGSEVQIEVFTTRLDTIFGVTFIVLSPEVARELLDLVPAVNKNRVEEYIKISLNKSEQQRKLNEKDKTGIETGIIAVNPVNQDGVPVFVADYVLRGVGTGAVMGVPAHDKRDFDFAKKYNLPIKEVISSGDPFSERGSLINSGKYSQMTSDEAETTILNDFKNEIQKTSTYHLRDWLISRQRYWGPPIPMIYCKICAERGLSWFNENKPTLDKDYRYWDSAGWYPEENLPVKLPEIDDYRPSGEGKGPLANHPEFYKTKCPHCSGEAVRETDVSDTFVDSSWYFLRYPSIDAESSVLMPFDPSRTKKWLPVDMYFGGAEHAVLHLMYARFVTKVLYDLKFLHFEEPFPRFFAHGLVIKDGAKMSKSRGNVVNPDDYIKKFGADTLRLYLMFLGPMDSFLDFKDTGIEGMRRFIERVWNLYGEHFNTILVQKKDAQDVLIKMHKTTRKVTEEISNFRYNTAIASIMELVNLLREKTEGEVKKSEKGGIRCAEWDEALKTLCLLLAPFAPYISEEIWTEKFGGQFSIHKQSWPAYVEEFTMEREAPIIIQVDGKLRSQMFVESEQSGNKELVVEKAKSDPRVAKWIEGKQILNTIFVPGKLVNFVSKR